MKRINAYYPRGTEQIIHYGKSGSQYYLDAVDIPIRINKSLIDNPQVNIIEVNNLDESVLSNSHSLDLLEVYRTGNSKSLAESSGLMWNNDFYQYVVNTAWTSIEAFKEALKNRKSIAITAGGHHAEYEKGLGFGPVNNMVIAAKELLKNNEVDRIVILDLDVHFANGTHSLVKNNKQILSCDLWKYKLSKWKYTPNSKNIYHLKVKNVEDYFLKLNNVFSRINNFRPDLLIVMNGLDVLETDRMGGVSGFGEHELDIRSKLVGEFASNNNYPITVFTGGGYVDHARPEAEVEIAKKNLQSYILKAFLV